MRKHLRPGIYALAGIVWCAEAFAVAPDSATNRYQAIPERNAFGLKPPPAIDAPPPPPAPIAKLILTGITTVLGNKLVLMKAVPPGHAPGLAVKEESFMLTEGQRQGNIEVLNIDEKAGSVRVSNSGNIVTLTFEKDGAKLASTPPSLTTPAGLPLPTNATVMSPATAPAALPGRGKTHKSASFPAREIRPSNVLDPGQSTSSANPGNEVGSPTVPSVGNPALDLPEGLTPEEQAIVLQLQQQSVSQQVSGAAPQGRVPGSPVPSLQRPVLPQ